MKKIRLIVIAIVSFAILHSCTDGRTDPYYDAPNQERWYTETLKVRAGDWILRGNINEIGSYYEHIFDNFPYVDGIINVYLYQNYGSTSEVQMPLPCTFYEMDYDSNGNKIPYSIQYSYDIAKDGTIALKIHVSDYLTGLLDLYDEYFRVAIIY
jgi:hypothetical protein